MVFPEFFFSKNAFGPHFPPTSLPCSFCHFCSHFHVFWLFLKVLGLRSRVSSHEMTIFVFQNGSDHQTHHFQQLSCWKQSQNRKKLEITRIAIRFSAKTGWSHGTGVPLNKNVTDFYIFFWFVQFFLSISHVVHHGGPSLHRSLGLKLLLDRIRPSSTSFLSVFLPILAKKTLFLMKSAS